MRSIGPPGRHRPGAKREPPDISRQVAEREPGAHKDPGWFINRSPTIALQRATVQADVPRSGERDQVLDSVEPVAATVGS
jgi:hypothetical protein